VIEFCEASAACGCPVRLDRETLPVRRSPRALSQHNSEILGSLAHVRAETMRKRGITYMSGIGPFRDFVRALADLADADPTEQQMLAAAQPLMTDLLARDLWLPDIFAQADAGHYRQYLLYCDLRERFSVVSFVWGPGQETPIHDHTVWGLLGVLRGAEISQRYERGDGAMHPTGSSETLEHGATNMVSPTIGDIHRVRNASKSRPTVSIHLYGGNIGNISRHEYTDTGAPKAFKSGYSLKTVPNLWDN
jgi:predicted metal-dependent enzyme (double-stranded beta helix superfamily)